MNRLVKAGSLVRKIVDGNAFITTREIVFGEERGHEKGVNGTKKSKMNALEWDSMTSVLKDLNWHVKSDPARDHDVDAVPDLAYSKLSEATCALERLMKGARSVKADKEAGLVDEGIYTPC